MIFVSPRLLLPHNYLPSHQVRLPGGIHSIFTISRLEVHAETRFHIKLNHKIEFPHIENASFSLRRWEKVIKFGWALMYSHLLSTANHAWSSVWCRSATLTFSGCVALHVLPTPSPLPTTPQLFPMIDSWINGLLVDCLSEMMLEPEVLQIYNVDPDYEPEGASGKMTASFSLRASQPSSPAQAW